MPNSLRSALAAGFVVVLAGPAAAQPAAGGAPAVALAPATSLSSAPTDGRLMLTGTPARQGGDRVELIQTTSGEVTEGFACRDPNTFEIQDSSMFRAFDLTAEGVTQPFRPDAFFSGYQGLAAADGTGSQPVSISMHLLTDPAGPVARDNFTTLYGVTGFIPDGTAVLGADNQAIPAVSPGQVLVYEVSVETSENMFFFGVNTAGATAPTYFESVPCNITTPETIAFDWVANVFGDEVAPPPANDALDDAIAMTGNGRYVGDNVAATVEAGEPAPACQPNYNGSTWWFFQAPGNGTVTLDFAASTYDTVVQVIDAAAGTAIGCNDDVVSGTLTSLIDAAPVEAGRTYLVQVAGFSSTVPRQGTTVFDYSFSPSTASEATPAGEVALTTAPNPARGAATVTLSVPAAQSMTVEVFDVTGRRVATLHDGAVAAGDLSLALDASALPSGVYVVRAVGETVSLSERLTVVR